MAPSTRRVAATLATILATSAAGVALAPPAAAATVTRTFTYSGSSQSFTVPSGVTAVTVEAWGGQGGASPYTAAPGKGAYVRSTVSVTAGQVLTVLVGGRGKSVAESSYGGWNGGGAGTVNGGGGGGGASEVRRGTSRLVVAGGGGGAGGNDYAPYAAGGDGGALGANGANGSGGAAGQGGGGAGVGTGGAGGAGPWFSGSPGSASGTGGNAGGDDGQGRGGGGGGGGYSGGGGGGAGSTGSGGGGGGGGSSYSVSTATFQNGVRTGDGRVVLTYSTPACADGEDNDDDGLADGADPGCTGPTDTSEGVECTDVAGVEVCVGISTGTRGETVVVYEPTVGTGDALPVVAYVDLYNVTLPGGGVVSVPCVQLAVTTVTANPCAEAGGTWTERRLVLAAPGLPTVGQGAPLATAAICEAELEATVDGVGVRSFPLVTLC
jgi:hypothetical protein